MKSLKRVGLFFVLVSVLCLTTFAGPAMADPCAPPAPGQTDTPPCAAAQVTPDDSLAPGQTNTPPASNAEVTPSVTEVAVDLLQSVLSLF